MSLLLLSDNRKTMTGQALLDGAIGVDSTALELAAAHARRGHGS